MAYRDESASLEERHRQLRRALEETRARSSLLTQEEAKIHEELAGLHRELQSSSLKRKQEKRKLPLANTLIASPCDVPWDQMVGNDRVRHCGQCKLDVHNLSAMTHDEVDQFLASLGLDSDGSKDPKPSERLPCINLFQRADGTIITSDCPVGMRMRTVRSFLAASLGVGVAALIGFTALACLSFWQTRSSHKLVDSYDDHSSSRRTPVLISPPRYIPNTGYISVEGPAGLDVYDENGHVGMTPMTFNASEGSHTIHVVDREGKTEYATTYVRSQSVSHVTVGLKPVVEQPVIRMAGAPPPPPPMRGAMVKRNF